MSNFGANIPVAPVTTTAISPSHSASSPSLDSANSQPTKTAGFPVVQHPQPPASPPPTLPASHAHDTIIATPDLYAFTPPESAPMSADPSQTAQGHAFDASVLPNPSSAPPVRRTSVTEHSVQDPRPMARDSPDPALPFSTNDLMAHESAPDHVLYKVGQSAYAKVTPRFSSDLFSLYSIDQIAADVARYHPITGEKNPLRKTYQNFVKDVSGKDKPVPKPGEFMDLLLAPDDAWHSQRVMGKEIRGDLPEDIHAKLDRALKMESGKLSKQEQDQWKSIMVLDDIANVTKPHSNLPNAPVAAANKSTNPTVSIPTPGEQPRLSRRGTKRRYDEDSFEGYGEGYLDDALDSADGDPDDDDRRGSGKKKRRRDTGGGSTTSFSGRVSPYNTGTISVGNGLYSNR